MGKRSIPPEEWVCRGFGLTPHNCRWHRLQILYSCVMAAVLCICMRLTPSLNGLTTQFTRMNVDVYNLQIKFTFGWSLAAIAFSYWDYRGGLEVVDDLKRIDLQSGTRMKRKFPIRLAVELVYMFGLCALEVSISYPVKEISLATLLFVNLFHGFTVPKVVVDRYTKHVDAVAMRFANATEQLKEGLFATQLTVHSQLISCASKISTVFGIEILLVLSSESCLIVYNLYNFRALLEFFQQNNGGTVLFMFISILWIFTWFLDIWHVIATTENMILQSKSFNEELLRLIVEDPTGEIAKNKKLRLHLGMKKEVKITAYGFFNIDGTFLYNLAAAVTTYLVILTQFRTHNDVET